MASLFSLFKKHLLRDFNGGIHPPEMKQQSSHQPLRTLPLPDYFIIPVHQHIGPAGELLVATEEQVLKGQPLTKGGKNTLPVHAPTSGVIVEIAPNVTAHPSGLKELCIRLLPDGKDTWYPHEPLADYHSLSVDKVLDHIHQSGIAGLGGAGFPTAEKLQGGLPKVETLIINAAECEPYITADDRLIQEKATEILQGCQILQHVLQPEKIIIGIEDNKTLAIHTLQRALSTEDSFNNISIKVVPTKYPSGGAKQLTWLLTGKEIPAGKHSASVGILMLNVGTLFAIQRAVLAGEPLIERVVTLTGNALASPGNVWARIGTPVEFLLQQAGYQPAKQRHPQAIMGGPLMGFTLPLLTVPIVKISNCILVPDSNELSPLPVEQACIRCSHCADACPVNLLPQQLYWFSKGAEHEKARQYHLFDCIECGACAYVCPSNIPLVHYYRREKAEIRALDDAALQATMAKKRFEAKQIRVEKEKLARQQRHQKMMVTPDKNEQELIAAAVKRANYSLSPVAAPEKELSISSLSPLHEQQRDSQQLAEVRQAREARKALARAAKNQRQDQAPSTTVDPIEAKKVAVAAAIARVKAKREQENSGLENPATVQNETPQDPKKAAVAAAIARVKAKRELENSNLENPAAVQNETPQDPKKAAVAAAIARVKAKRGLENSSLENPAAMQNETPQDPKKAAVAAAIARVKAKRELENSSLENPAAMQNETPQDPKKAAVAAAIARVKAKREQQNTSASDNTSAQESKTLAKKPLRNSRGIHDPKDQ